MTLTELLAEIRDRNLSLAVKEGELVVQGKKQALKDPAVVALLRENKARLIEALQSGITVEARTAAIEVPPNGIAPGCTAITPSMLPLAELTQDEIDAIVARVPGGAANVQDIYQLAPLQEGILFHHMMVKEGDPYLQHLLLAFADRGLLQRYIAALQTAVQRHDILRTSVVWEGVSRPVQVVWRQATLRVDELHDLGADAAAALRERYDPRHHRIDLAEAPLLRLVIAHDAANGRWLALQLFHHLVADHTTLDGLQKEVQAHLLGLGDRLAAPMPFRNYVAQARLGVPVAEHEAFFRKMLGDVDEPTAPFGMLDVQGDGTRIEESRLMVEPGLAARLRERARLLGVSTAALCHVAWAMVLARVSARDDVVFGTVLFGRMQGGAAADRVLGMFINTLPIRIAVGEQGTQAGVLQAQALLAQLLRHEHAPLAMAQRCSAIGGGRPLFSAFLNYRHSAQAMDASPEAASAWSGVQVLGGEERTNYPFSLDVDDFGEAFALTAQVRPPVAPERVCAYMHTALARLADALEHAPGTPLSALDVMPAEERRLLSQWNDTAQPHADDPCLHELFEMQARRQPEAVALLHDLHALAYGALNERANQLARHLRGQGVGPDVCVGVCMQRGIDTVMALMAVLKAGGAYVPLDPDYPLQRLELMVRDCEAAVVLVNGESHPMLHAVQESLGQGLRIIDVQADAADWAALPGTDLARAELGLEPDHLAYVIYTSGSTGEPKGVMVTHRSVCNQIRSLQRRMDLAPQDRLLQFYRLAFDVSVEEIFGSLCSGASLVLRTPEWLADAPAFWGLCASHGVTVLDLPTLFWEHLVQDSQAVIPASLRRVVIGGDAVSSAALKAWFTRPGHRPVLANAYGPTETTINATLHEPTGWDPASLAIGRPLANMRVHLLDARRRPVPIGAVGEIHIAGPGVARGYLNRPELSAERFIVVPDLEDAPVRLYRTGDLGRHLPDGSIQFLGRNDFQVKVRGFRVELEEIEACLARHPSVWEAVVVAHGERAGDKRLVAYCTPSPAAAEQVSADELRTHLLDSLPEYMVPSLYVMLQEFPRTANGKLDRAALPHPDLAVQALGDDEDPATPEETTIAKVWAEALKLERVGRDSHFFELGGHSLLAIGVVERLRRAGLRTDVRTLFAKPTVRSLAAAIAGTGASELPRVPPNRIPAHCEAITPDMLPLVELDDAAIRRIVDAVPGGAGNIQDIYPLAPLQEGMLFHHLMSDAGDVYLTPMLFGFDTRSRAERFVQALQAVIDRHDIFRSAVMWEGLPEPVQVVWRQAPLTVQEATLDKAAGDAGRQLLERFDTRLHRLDIRQAPLMRVVLAHDSAQARWVALLLFHHLAGDHTTTEVLREEMQAFLAGRQAELPATIAFREFVAQSRLGVPREDHEAFFRGMLGDVSEPSAPFGLLDTRGDGSGIVQAQLALDPSLARGLRECARTLRIGAASLAHLAFARVLGAVCGRHDVVFGTMLFGRMHGAEGADRVPGLFINTLPIRLDLGHENVKRAALRTHELLSQLMRHEHAPLSLAQRCSAVPAPSPLFGALFNYRHGAAGAQLLEHQELQAWEGVSFLGGEERTNFPLTLAMDDWGEGFSLTAQVQPAVDPVRVCAYMNQALAQLVNALQNAPDMLVQQVDVLPAAERHLLLEAWNTTRLPPAGPDGPCVHELFEAHAALAPSAVAMLHGDGQLSYAELNARANQLAHHLIGLGIKPEDRIAICMVRSFEMVVAVLAVLKAGGAYVPLDPAYPVERLNHMLRDSAPVAVLACGGLPPGLQPPATVLDLGADSVRWRDGPSHNPDRVAIGLRHDHLAYVIYTSGSTGAAKGVMVEHGTLAASQAARTQVYGGYGRFLLLSSLAFDSSVAGLFGTLAAGGTLCLPRQQDALSLPALRAAIRGWGVTSLLCVPSLLQVLLGESRGDDLATLTTVIVAGESCPPSLVTQAAQKIPQATIYNEYGPTENTVWATVARCTASDDATLVPIGRPIANTRIYVLDSCGEPVPIGVTGELHIGGSLVARGYLNRPALTAERFVADPFSGQPQARMYKTGDLVRHRADGNLEFLGRNDHQVKIRGVRIELGEIEAQLMKHPQVREAAVIAREDIAGDTRLVAYVTPSAGQEEAPRPDALRAHLLATLPEVMVPAAYVVLEHLPLNVNGKLDRKALPLPGSAAGTALAVHVPARNDAERLVAGIWKDVLHTADVGMDDNFFELGGHSLLMVQLHSRLSDAFGRQFPLIDLFRHTTVAAQAAHLSSQPAAELAELPQIATRRDTGGGDIAVIGMAGRFPGARDVDEFWHNLRRGHESVEALDDATLQAHGVTAEQLADPHYVKAEVTAIEDIDCFDARFFRFNPRDAQVMDPQQRLFLEAAWHALEHAGCDPQRFDGRIGVYAGQDNSQYLSENLLGNPRVAEVSSAYQVGIGNQPSSLASQVAYRLNLKGPAMSVQTACSTSAVAVHLACQAIANGECEMALAGGVSLTLGHGGYVYTPDGILSPDGHCRPFDAQAQGTTPGSGLGLVVLKPLADALRDGDTVHAVIKGSAVNNDGAQKVGFTAPSEDGQVEVIRQALARAGVDPATIGYVEAHGTGTVLGDPIEAAALARVFGPAMRDGTRCAIGSVKSNIGHLDSAAGIAGIIKTVLALRHRQLPPSLNFKAPNPHIDWAHGPLQVNTELRDWPALPGQPRRAGVSSFGIGGTNVHLVLEEAPAMATSEAAPGEQLLVLSAQTEQALDEGASRLAAHLRAHPDASLADVAWTLQVGRQALPHRRTVVARDGRDALQALEVRDAMRREAVVPGQAPTLVFMFTGQGAQHVNMARGLYENEPVFRQALQRCAELLAPQLGTNLLDLLYPGPADVPQARERLNETAFTQPALFAVEYAMAQLWASWGVKPQAMIGHSIGEYVAAHLAGVFTLEDALALVARRGALMQAQPRGAMLSVALPAAQLVPELDGLLALAAVNAPGLCVVSGACEAIDALESRLRLRGTECTRLHTSHAFHSPMMEPVLQAFADCVAGVPRQAPRLPFVSNLTGTWITAEEACDPAYWARHLREAVRFSDGMATLLTQHRPVLLELGPGRTLATLARQHQAPVVLGSIRAAHHGDGVSDRAHALASLGQLWAAGVEVDWRGLHGSARHRVPLPGYAFAKERHWIEPPSRDTLPDAVPRKRSDPADWLYEPSWTRCTLPPVAPERANAPWLLLLDEGGLALRMAQMLQARGTRAITVRAGQAMRLVGVDAFTIDPLQREDHRALLRQLTMDHAMPAVVVHAWNLVGQSPDADAMTAVDRAESMGLDSLVLLAQALEDHRGPGESVRILAVCDQLHAVLGDEPVQPEQALLLGPSQVMGCEYPDIRCTTVDVVAPQPGSDAEWMLAEQLIAQAEADDDTPVVAYRGKHRWVRTLQALQSTDVSAAPSRLRERGVVLVTGGLGGIGLSLAEHLVRRVRARLVLVGRTPMPARANWEPLSAHDPAMRNRIERLLAIEALGAEVVVECADVADIGQMRGVIDRVHERFGALHGVIHAAGVAGGQLIQQKTPRSGAAVLDPKVKGTLVLDALVQGMPLDFFVLCSSLASLDGFPGETDYGAANAFLDAFAQRNAQRGGPFTVSIHWDSWQSVGMAAEAAQRLASPQHRAASLAHGLLPAEGGETLERILALGLPEVAVCTRDVERLLALRRTAATAARAQAQHEAPPQNDADAPDGHVPPSNHIEESIAAMWRALLGVERVGIHDDFFELGGHSLLATQLASRIRQQFSVQLPLRQLIDAPTVAATAQVVAHEMLAGVAADDMDSVHALLAEVQRMSADELARQRGMTPVNGESEQ